MSTSLSNFIERAHPESNNVTIAFDTDLNISLLYVGVAGDIELMLEGGNGTSKIYKDVPIGTFISLPIKQIVAAGTTSTTTTDFVGHR